MADDQDRTRSLFCRCGPLFLPFSPERSMQFSMCLYCLSSRGREFCKIFLCDRPDFSMTLNSKPDSFTVFRQVFLSSKEGGGGVGTKIVLKYPPLVLFSFFVSPVFLLSSTKST